MLSNGVHVLKKKKEKIAINFCYKYILSLLSTILKVCSAKHSVF